MATLSTRVALAATLVVAAASVIYLVAQQRKRKRKRQGYTGVEGGVDRLILIGRLCCVLAGVAAWLIYSRDQMLHGEPVSRAQTTGKLVSTPARAASHTPTPSCTTPQVPTQRFWATRRKAAALASRRSGWIQTPTL